MVGKSQAPMFRGERPRETRLAPEWTLERMASTPSTSGSRPRTPHAATTASPSIRDGKLTLTYTETNAAAKKQLYAKVKSMLGKLDMNPDHLIHRFAYMKNDIPIGGCATRPAPRGSAPTRARPCLDTNCKAHEVDNLYVVDTSIFPSIGAVNPRSPRWRTRFASATTCWSGSQLDAGCLSVRPTDRDTRRGSARRRRRGRCGLAVLHR
jgi:hypothetical protein